MSRHHWELRTVSLMGSSQGWLGQHCSWTKERASSLASPLRTPKISTSIVNGYHPEPVDTCLSELMGGFFNTGLYGDANNFIRMTGPSLYEDPCTVCNILNLSIWTCRRYLSGFLSQKRWSLALGSCSCFDSFYSIKEGFISLAFG